jgi:hypothetical protein
MDPDDNDDYGGIPPQPIKITAMNDGDDFLPPIPPHDHDGYANEDEEDDDTEIDRLPDFANDKAKELHFDIKQHTERLEKINADLLETRSRLDGVGHGILRRKNLSFLSLTHSRNCAGLASSKSI